MQSLIYFKYQTDIKFEIEANRSAVFVIPAIGVDAYCTAQHSTEQ